MTERCRTNDLWALVEPLLPLKRPKLKRSRPLLRNRAVLAGMLFALLSGIVPEYSYATPSWSKREAPSVTLAEIQDSAPAYGTFQSNNRLVVQNGHGIFIVHLYNQSGKRGFIEDWKLQRSTDNGETFRTLYRAEVYNHATAPALETDENDNVYMIGSNMAQGSSDLSTGYIYWIKLSPSDNYASAKKTIIPNVTPGAKKAAIYDQTRRQFYFTTFIAPKLFTIGMDGSLIRSVQLFAGSDSVVEYPQFAMDGSRLYLAWTTANAAGLYDGIHFIYSDDGGITWYAPGSSAPLTLPIVPDDSGPTPEIVPPQYVGNVSTWLSSFVVLDGVAHFFYSVGKDGEVYQRFSIAPFAKVSESIGKWNKHGGTIYGLDGFFTVTGSTIYAVGADGFQRTVQGRSPIVVLESEDNGATWTEFARSAATVRPYAINGPRETRADHGITGIFVNYPVWPASGAQNAQQIYFLQAPIEQRLTHGGERSSKHASR